MRRLHSYSGVKQESSSESVFASCKVVASSDVLIVLLFLGFFFFTLIINIHIYYRFAAGASSVFYARHAHPQISQVPYI